MTERLESHLSDTGLPCRVEERHRLAILIFQAGVQWTAGDRHRVLQLAREEGYTHVAVEIDPDGASLPGD